MTRIGYVGMDMLASAFVYLSARRDVDIRFLATGTAAQPAAGVTRHARLMNTPVLEDPDDDALVAAIAREGVDLVVVAAYHRKLPAARIAEAGARAVNVHPSLLPDGRGPTPMLHVAIDPARRAAAGVSLHKLTERLDAGDVLLSRAIAMADEDGYDALEARVFALAPALVGAFIDDADRLWSAATPQAAGAGSYWPRPDETAWTFDARGTVAEARAAQARFGGFGARINLAGGPHFYGRILSASTATHIFPIGGLLLIDGKVATVSLRDGLMRVALF